MRSAGSFFLLERWRALRPGAVPLRLPFNTEPSARRLDDYLGGAEPVDEVYAMALSNMVDAVGVVPAQSTARRYCTGHCTGAFRWRPACSGQ